MHPIAHIIAKFGATIGMDGLETENGVCTLRFDDVTVTLECAENDGALYLYSRVCGLPESDADKLALYGLLLELDSFFKGTDGGVLGIEPLLDAVTYTRRLPLEQLDESLDVLLGMVGRPYFTEQTIAKEQGIIGQEIKMYDDSADWRLITGLCECLYHSHPIRSDIAGTVESIAEITPEMLYDCCKAFYAPNNMVLAAAGSTSMEQILAACARHGLMEARPVERVQRLWTEEPMTLAATEKTITMPVSKPCFGIGFKEQPLQHDDLRSEILYDLILCCISGGMSRLYRKLYDEGLTNPGFGGEVLRVDGCCCILFTGESDVPDTVKQLLLEEIRRIRAEGVDREIFTLCKNEKYGQLIENLENVEDSASQMADFALSGQTVAQQIATLAALTAEDADAALQKILSEERMAVMYIQPDGTAGEELDDEEEMEE